MFQESVAAALPAPPEPARVTFYCSTTASRDDALSRLYEEAHLLNLYHHRAQQWADVAAWNGTPCNVRFLFTQSRSGVCLRRVELNAGQTLSLPRAAALMDVVGAAFPEVPRFMVFRDVRLDAGGRDARAIVSAYRRYAARRDCRDIYRVLLDQAHPSLPLGRDFPEAPQKNARPRVVRGGAVRQRPHAADACDWG